MPHGIEKTTKDVEPDSADVFLVMDINTWFTNGAKCAITISTAIVFSDARVSYVFVK